MSFSDQRLNPGPLLWECGVLAARPAGKSQHKVFQGRDGQVQGIYREEIVKIYEDSTANIFLALKKQFVDDEEFTSLTFQCLYFLCLGKEFEFLSIS